MYGRIRLRWEAKEAAGRGRGRGQDGGEVGEDALKAHARLPLLGGDVERGWRG